MFEIPTDFSALTDEALAEALAGAREALAALVAIEESALTDEQVDQMEALGAFLNDAAALRDERVAAASARTERIAAARAALPEEPVVEEPAAVEEPVVAAAPRRAAAAAAAAAPEVAAPARPAAVLTAAADVPGFGTGARMEGMDDIVKAAMAKFGAMPKGNASGKVYSRHGVVRIEKPRSDNFIQGQSYTSDMDMLMAASDETRLPGGALTAAGGWCAPSETLYDLVTHATTDGLIDLPEVQINRGGVRYTRGPDFAPLYASLGWDLTEAEVIAEEPKPCVEIECPDFEDHRLDAVGLCVRAGILTNAAWPELVRHYIENVLIAHQHKISAKMVTGMNTVAGAATSVVNAFATSVSLLTALELVAQGERQNLKMRRDATLEVVLPFWAKTAIRADLSVRTGVNELGITDQQIEAYFRVRGLRVQFIYGYQPLTGTPVINFPATIEALIYPAGTFIKGTTDVINLDAVYDSTLLAVNTYTALFAEEGVMLLNMQHDPRRISLPLNVTGVTAAAILNQDWGTATEAVDYTP